MAGSLAANYFWMRWSGLFRGLLWSLWFVRTMSRRAPVVSLWGFGSCCGRTSCSSGWGLSSNGTENLHKKSPRKPDLRHSDRLHASIGGLEWRSARSGTLIALSINLPSAWFAGHRFLNGFMRRKHPKTAVIVPTMRASNKPGFVGKPQPASLCRFSVPLLLRPPPCLLQHFAQVLCPVHD